jgi:hypothetical protein
VFRDEDIAEKVILHTSGARDDLIGAFIDSIMGPSVSAILLGVITLVPRKKLYLRENNVQESRRSIANFVAQEVAPYNFRNGKNKQTISTESIT